MKKTVYYQGDEYEVVWGKIYGSNYITIKKVVYIFKKIKLKRTIYSFSEIVVNAINNIDTNDEKMYEHQCYFLFAQMEKDRKCEKERRMLRENKENSLKLWNGKIGD